MLKKVLVANRGEIALRVIRACQELKIPAVAVYSDADSEALHTRHADEAVNIGPPPAGKSYLNIEALLEAAKETGAEAIHPGYGFLAKLLVGPRHVEVQVMGDQKGNVVRLFERECSMQRRRQKVLEESPSPGIGTDLREEMTEAAVRLAREVEYANAGTVEFLVEDEDFYFIEMNTRIQVEHPVTEMLTGVDLVKEQIRVASGEPLSIEQQDVPFFGHAMEFRINAEDPDKNFMPSPGEISFLDVPGGPGVRVDSAIYQGYKIPPFYDSMVGKLIVWALTREEAIYRARRALREYRIEGIKTTIPLHMRLLEGEAFRSGEYHTGYLEELLNGD